jgi:hypothetical protein
MVSILLEVKNPNSYNYGFYNPAPAEFKKYPRTEQGIQKAITELLKIVNKYEWIEDYRIMVYYGKYESYKKDMQPSFMVDSTGSIIELN